MVARLKDTRTPVLITQERAGYGKELVTQPYIHFRGTSCEGTLFVAVDCGALVPTLIESDWTRKKARSPARSALFRLRDDPFLDEIRDSAGSFQAKLLRVSCRKKKSSHRQQQAREGDVPTFIQQLDHNLENASVKIFISDLTS